MSSNDFPNSDNSSKLHDDAKSPFHDPSSWPSWITHGQNSLASPGLEVPVDSEATTVSSHANDGPTSLSASNYSSIVKMSDDNLSVGSLVLSDKCPNAAANSDDSKQEDKVQAYCLIDSVNTSDDIKSSGSPMPSRGSSVHRTSGAVSKKHQGGAPTGKGSWSSAMEKGLKIISKGSSSHKESGVTDDAVSPSSLAPPPPPPTPNVLTSDSSQEHSFLAGVSPSQVPFSTARRSGSLASWPPPSSSGKRTSAACATNSTSSHHKEAGRSSNLLNLFSSAKSEIEDSNDGDYLVLDSPTRRSVYGISTNHSLYENSGEANSGSMSKTIPIERCSTLNSRSINSSPNSSLASVHGPDAPGVSSQAEGTVSTSTHADVGACYTGHSSNSSQNSSNEACSTHGLPPSSTCGSTRSSMVHLTVSGGSSSSSHSAPLASSGASSSPVSACSSTCSCGRVPAVRVCSSSSSAAQGLSSSGSVRASSSDRQSNAPASASNEAEPALHQRPPVHNAKAGPMYNWQATLTTVKERFAFLFNNEILSDVQFVVGRGEDEQNIPAHKFVLAVGSAVFDAMFNGQLASQQQLIRLPDVEPQAFLALLSFLYSDEVQIGPETVMTVLYTAKKYAVPALERRCVDFLKTNLSSDNAFMLLTQARLFDEPQLAALCLKTIDKCTAEAIVAEGFTDIDHDTLSLVLQRDTLRIKELHLFQAVCRWAEAECVRQGCGSGGRQQRAVLGQALKLIRFPLMTVEEFAQGPAQSGILMDAEVVQLFLYFSVNPKPSVDFIDVPRCCMTGKEQTMCRFQSTEARWGYSGTPDRIRFIVDRRIFVVGFGMYGSIHGPSEYEVTVQLIHTLTGKVCGSNETVFTSDGTCNTFRVMFPDPIEVLPNTNYTAYATLKGPDSHYGTKGLRKVIVECPSGDRVCFQFSYAAGNNNGTSVEDGQIPEIIFYT